LPMQDAKESAECIAGLVLQGLKRPYDCPAFGTRCTPDTPLGAPMVSSEGACAAYFHFGRRKDHVDSLVSLAAAGH
jgi:hydrogenase expression/formation protein HypD